MGLAKGAVAPTQQNPSGGGLLADLPLSGKFPGWLARVYCQRSEDRLSEVFDQVLINQAVAKP